MARRTLLVIDVLRCCSTGTPDDPRWCGREPLGVDVKSVRKYVAAAEAAGIFPGDGSDRAGWAGRVAQWFPELVDAKARSRTWPLLDQRRALIETMIETSTVATVHQRLRGDADVSVGEAQIDYG